MDGAVGLPTWMLHVYLDDWNEVLIDILRKFLCSVKITHFMKPIGMNY